MAKEELLRDIDVAFEEAGEKESWLYDSYRNLYRLNQLSHFQIFELNWFPGAARILNLIDQLHTIVTSKEEFLSIAKLLNLTLDPSLDKAEIAQQVKKHQSWRAKSFDLDAMKKIDLRKQQLKPLYDELSKWGYKTKLLPKQMEFKKWILDATNREGETETIYLNESDEGNYVLVQSTTDLICVLDAVESGLIESI
ncbi:hypothetical protein [Priestia megaterium]|uniref:hypothetical protein n=1 Tax=Priestia megaterium TaxID=1404 RepID=UPI000BFDECA0|nr:hypothetical protein [Priestia megaterium]PGQ88157.1 hypothetical protein COA18_04335 [Priestia megaterium]